MNKSSSKSAAQVSIAMPCWNAAATLDEAIDSIKGQTFADWELIAIDDGSSDNTLDLLREHVQCDGRIRVISMTHGGLVAALIRGCKIAGGEFIARMDADDIAIPDRLERQVKAMHDDPQLGLCGTQVIELGSTSPIGRRAYIRWLNGIISPSDVARNLFIECPVAHPTFMVRRAAYEEVGGYRSVAWAEDYDLVLRMHALGWKIANVPEKLLEWREHPARLSRTDPRYSHFAFRECKRHYLRETLLKNGRRFYQWGAGKVGKGWLREWFGRHPIAVVDVNPRKIGIGIHGYQVISPDELPRNSDAAVVVAVGAAGARDEIRADLESRGYRETRDFYFVA